MLKITQCVKLPPGASTSTHVNAIERVSSGTLLHAIVYLPQVVLGVISFVHVRGQRERAA